MKKQKRLRLLVLASVIVCAMLLVVFFSSASNSVFNRTPQVSYEFTNIRRGTVERTVSSSGTINPVSTAKVLPQMSGKVERIFVDYNDTVRRGDILAELNTDTLRLKRDQQYASVLKARANYELQLINYRSQEALAERNLISEYDLRVSKTALDNQAADLEIAEANLKVIETEINQYAYITSPIDGIVLDRRINVGDTVVDSSNSSSTAIFTLAENLSEMQIEATVGELDVVSIHRGQPVRFSLESIRGRSFPGEVEILRMVPTVSNSVVSYTVIVKVENLDGSLMPGMTCAVDFIVERSEDVLLVPNAALRYQPASQSTAPASSQNANASITNLMMGGAQGGRAMGGFSGGGGGRQGPGQAQGRTLSQPVVMRNLWYISDEGKPESMQVEAGISNGSFTEIRATDEDLEGRQVILRERI